MNSYILFNIEDNSDFLQKRASGKTTLAISLSVEASLSKKQSAIIDLDPPTSSTNEYDAREQQNPVVVSAQLHD